jgi:sensitive to high expression protein 9
MAKLMDDLLARASVASQHINAYTGTDFSGIEALRKEILDQEQKVRGYRREVDDTKASHHEAHAKQSSHQREIVGLLERKASWSPSDLERYMSLVRSEHLNERDVQIAKDNLAAAERNLEDARSLLERLERKQYHEEQIWSDTIRRNSTWVTFGLMGVNILLLLTQIAVFEPNRRKKIVRDVKAALDERTFAASSPTVSEPSKVADEVTTVPVAVEEDKTIPDKIMEALLPPEDPVDKKSEDAPLAAETMLPPEASDFIGAVPVEKAESPADVSIDNPSTKLPLGSTMEVYQEMLHDLFSERIVQVKKVDLTTAALQGAASGVALMSFLFLLFRPR